MDHESKAKRVALPADDPVVAEWLAAQTNASLSLRMLVHRWCDEHGATDVPMDVACAPVAEEPGSLKVEFRCADEEAADAFARGLFVQVGGSKPYASQHVLCYRQGTSAVIVALMDAEGDVEVSVDAGGGDDGRG